MGMRKLTGQRGKGRTPILPVRVPTPLRNRLEQLARHDRRSLSDFVRLVLEDFVEGRLVRR